MQGIDPQDVHQLLSGKGPLAQHLKGFEWRPQQVEMMQTIIEALNNDAVALIEAGTGTGKSIAYLLPVLLLATRTKKRTVISTNTINLQEQLIYKDLPLLIKAFQCNLKIALVKGMNNYVCLRKLNNTLSEKQLLEEGEMKELEQIERWSSHTTDGSRSDLSICPSHSLWSKVNAESDLCNYQKCPHYQQCHFFKARRKANDAQVLIVNHHLLFADLAFRAETKNYTESALLPPYQQIVIDEAHHIEEVATNYFANRVDYLGLIRTLGRLASESHSHSSGKLSLLSGSLKKNLKDNLPKQIMTKLSVDLPALKKKVQQEISLTFQSFFTMINEFYHNDTEQKLRLKTEYFSYSIWQKQVIPHTKELIATLHRYTESLRGLQDSLKNLKNDQLNEKIESLLFDINSLACRLDQMRQILDNFIHEEIPSHLVRWLEGQQLKTLTNIHLVEAKLNIAQEMAELLFTKFPSTILCSATLTSNQEFTFIRDRLGLSATYLGEKPVFERIFPSSFDFQKQTLLAVPSTMCAPTHVDFPKQVQTHLWQAIQCSRGNAFILFTSYSLLHQCYQNLQKRLRENLYVPLKQGERNRNELLKQFRTTNRSVLFGTDSFWEGVDVAGDALRCVIIVRLPFQVPTEPIIQARAEAIAREGKNPFFTYSLPQAVVKFKQGFGRLIRTKNDRGCILCLDTRLRTKYYGRLFLNSLPPCQFLFAPADELYPKIDAFYRSTYHFVKAQSFPT